MKMSSFFCAHKHYLQMRFNKRLVTFKSCGRFLSAQKVADGGTARVSEIL